MNSSAMLPRFGLLGVALALAAALVLSACDNGTDERTVEPGPMRVLVFWRATEFFHLSIPVGLVVFEQLGDEHGFAVETTQDPSLFNDEDLARFGAVVFFNTTGDVMDTDEQREAFERYVCSGGGYVGVHAASDTEYDWPFYGEVLLGGAWFPSHPIQQFGEIVIGAPDHPSTEHLPERWTVFDEVYSSGPTRAARYVYSPPSTKTATCPTRIPPILRAALARPA